MAKGRLFAIGDVHGCSAELHQLLDELAITPDDQLLFVGDLIDRGERSQQVVETVTQLHDYCRVKVVLGNHEAMMLDFLRTPDSPDAGAFIFNGGSATLASYADDRGAYTIPQRHLEFLESLELFYEADDFFLVHAGVPEIGLHMIDAEHHRDELLWSRSMSVGQYRWSKLIVHGHTYHQAVELEPHRINVDAGCVYGGHLAAVELRTREAFYVPRRPPKEPVRLRDRSSRRAAVRFGGEVLVRMLREGQWVDYVTVNYNEIGLYLRAVSPEGAELWVGERVRGIISPAGQRAVRFRGNVVRIDRRDDRVYYGLKIHLLD